MVERGSSAQGGHSRTKEPGPHSVFFGDAHMKFRVINWVAHGGHAFSASTDTYGRPYWIVVEELTENHTSLGLSSCFRLAAKDIYPLNPKLACDLLLRRSAKTVEVPCHAYGFQTCTGQNGHELCLRQSAGDSSSPEVDVAADGFREGCPDRDVSEV